LDIVHLADRLLVKMVLSKAWKCRQRQPRRPHAQEGGSETQERLVRVMMIVWVAFLVAIRAINACKYQPDHDNKGGAMFLSGHSVTSKAPSWRYEYMSTYVKPDEFKYALKRVFDMHVGCL
jgi:hypothetical protein